MKIIRVAIEVDDCVRCPNSTSELSDFLYGIADGQCDGRVTITDSPVAPNKPAYMIPAEEGDVQVWNVDGLGPVLPLDGLLTVLRDLQIDKISDGEGALKIAIETVEEISQDAAKQPVVRLADEFYPEAV